MADLYIQELMNVPYSRASQIASLGLLRDETVTASAMIRNGNVKLIISKLFYQN